MLTQSFAGLRPTPSSIEPEKREGPPVEKDRVKGRPSVILTQNTALAGCWDRPFGRRDVGKSGDPFCLLLRQQPAEGACGPQGSMQI